MTRYPNALVALFALLMLTAVSPRVYAQQTRWCGSGQGNSLEFIGAWENEEFRGLFRRFQVELEFDPLLPGSARLRVEVDVTSAFSDNTIRDEALAEPDWFHFADFPRARFSGLDGAVAVESGFRIDGILELKGRGHPVSITFEWKENESAARMRGDATLDRTWFGVGEGEWRDDSVIAHRVRLEFDVGLGPCTNDP